MFISRESILNLMDYYRSDDKLTFHRINVTFEGENIAEDMDGLSREMLTCFLKAALSKYFEGSDAKVPKVDHDVMDTDVFSIIGKIISHAYVLLGYFPMSLCKASLCALFDPNVDSEMITSSFLKLLPPLERDFMNTTLKDPITLKVYMWELLGFAQEDRMLLLSVHRSLLGEDGEGQRSGSKVHNRPQRIRTCVS
ncbi:uncharacterized protein LOC135499127 [Lineus longissimus]|uniref:uncharacterized protein LOC135499127 n=1 Tax=Lineus longissimus TaxID=88925 RepID=UPI00315D53C1